MPYTIRKASSEPLVSVSLLSYNGEAYLKNCLNSVCKQDYPRFELLITDNNSKDGTVELLRVFLRGKSRADITFKRENIGFAKGHNENIKRSRGKYIVVLNQDVVLGESFIKNAVRLLEQDKKIGAVQGKIFREPGRKIIDSIGLAIFKNRRIVNRGQGMDGNANYNKKEEVFGADGAAPVYRKKALDEVKICAKGNCEYFDEDFFIYKEDVDLSWRMRLYGWKIVYEPRCVAYHWRGSGDSAEISYLKIVKERRKLKEIPKFYSFKNQRLMQVKNEVAQLFIRDIIRILFKEIGSWLYIIFFEHNAIKIIKALIKQTPNALKKRKIIMKNKAVSNNNLRKWFL